jgi:hypothetical protein
LLYLGKELDASLSGSHGFFQSLSLSHDHFHSLSLSLSHSPSLPLSLSQRILLRFVELDDPFGFAGSGTEARRFLGGGLRGGGGAGGGGQRLLGVDGDGARG